MKRKPTPAQIAARERFAEMARSGAFKKKAAKARKAKANPAKKTVSQKVSQLTREGYPQKQAVAIALSEKRAGKVKRNPISDIANIIYNQLGANRFAMMTGAKSFVAGDNFLMFSIGKNQSVYNKVRITLTPDDLYDLEFFKMNRLGDISKTQKFEGIYAEQLQDLFTQVTGLYTSMGTMGRRNNPRASNPQARSVKHTGARNIAYAVQAKRMLPGGASQFETVAGFPTKAQAQDYISALLKNYPKGLTLRISAA